MFEFIIIIFLLYLLSPAHSLKKKKHTHASEREWICVLFVVVVTRSVRWAASVEDEIDKQVHTATVRARTPFTAKLFPETLDAR